MKQETIPAATYRQQNSKGRKSKYRNVKTEVDGRVFDSAKEANRYRELRLLEKAGEISHLECQPKFNLVSGTRPVLYASGRQATYTADFAYFNGEKRVVEDVKSSVTKTQVYKLKKALVEAQHPAVRIVEV